MLLISFWIFTTIIVGGAIALAYMSGELHVLLLGLMFAFMNWIGHELAVQFRNDVVYDGPVAEYIVEEKPYSVVYHIKGQNDSIAQSIKIDTLELYNAHRDNNLTIGRYHLTTLFNAEGRVFYKAEVKK